MSNVSWWTQNSFMLEGKYDRKQFSAFYSVQYSSLCWLDSLWSHHFVHLLSCVWLSATPWTAGHQASFSVSQTHVIELMMITYFCLLILTYSKHAQLNYPCSVNQRIWDPLQLNALLERLIFLQLDKACLRKESLSFTTKPSFRGSTDLIMFTKDKLPFINLKSTDCRM